MEKKINKNQNCHDELLAQLSENYDNVEKLALSEINNLEFVMPAFSSLGFLSRYKFNLFLRKIKKVRNSAQYLATLTGICVDSLTCMIKSSSLYVAYLYDNKMLLNLLQEIIGETYMVVANNTHYIPPESLSALITILERSATRIQFKEISFFDELTIYIKRLRFIEKLYIDNKYKKQLTKYSDVKNTKPVTGVSGSSLKTITPVTVPIKHSDDCMKELNGAQGLFQHKINSNTFHVIGIENGIEYKNLVGSTKHYIMKELATNQNQINNFGSKVMQENKKVPQLFIKKDIFEPKKQPLCVKRPRDDTDFDNQKENVLPPTKILKLESTSNTSSCHEKIEKYKDIFEVLMSRSALKKK